MLGGRICCRSGNSTCIAAHLDPDGIEYRKRRRLRRRVYSVPGPNAASDEHLIGDNLVLIAEVANVSDIECKRIHQLHTNMLLSLNKHKTLFGLLIQGHQVYLAEYTFDQAGGYKREFSQKAFKYQREDLKLLYSYLQTHFMSK